MTISYNWLSDYLPVKVEPQKLSRILTSIGLEVENMEVFEEIKGGLQGLIIGEVLEAVPHPNADKLRLTKVTIGDKEPLQIVCGAPNVAAGQKVVVATVGTTIYPTAGEPVTMKVAKIRGAESYGMICAEDEIGLGDSHAGILVLPGEVKTGTTAANYFKPYSDVIFEIGLTPNRMDAMSHLGVARDVCAYLTHHERKEAKPIIPPASIKKDSSALLIEVTIENKDACKRYSGVSIANINVMESPKWLQERLKAIGLRPINNIVDITNYVQYETGQPLHAFDYNAIKEQSIVVKNLPDGTLFKTLDDKDRKLSPEDLMICDAVGGICIAGVFGGAGSGVTLETKNIFLESAYFDPGSIRKTSFRHGLRTDAATRFEKGIDISNTVNVLKRAASLIKEIVGGEVASDIIDVYPQPQPKTEVILKNSYLKKLSGKNYHSETVKNILKSLGFGIVKEGMDALTVEVPYHKPDVSLPADVVEEIVRIDGLDNIAIPTAITITPSVEKNFREDGLKEKVAQHLTGSGFTEILTNSITASKYFSESELATAIKLLNNLSNELDVMRPAMLPTALEAIRFNSNRKNSNLQLFEWGKTYSIEGTGSYKEQNHLCLYVTGQLTENSWKKKNTSADLFYIKGMVEALFKLMGIQQPAFEKATTGQLQSGLTASINGEKLAELGQVTGNIALLFDIKQPVLVVDFNWEAILKYAAQKNMSYKEVPKYLAVERDLAVVVAKGLPYEEINNQLGKLQLPTLQEVRLFDVFQSEKLGEDRKSMAINFTFLDEEKTLTDKEIDGWMNKIMATLEKEVGAEIRK
jgi:phenylalanyl-tRNA synthetase beta chain